MALRARSGGTRLIGDRSIFPGAFASPANGAVIVDTGPLDGGLYFVTVIGAAAVDFVYDLQHRNAANDAMVVNVNTVAETVRRRCSAGNEECWFPVPFTLAANERLRCIAVGTPGGEVQLSLCLEQAEP